MTGYRASLSIKDRYQLRLLAGRNRFYGSVHNLRSLEQRGLEAPTSKIDVEGRTEWPITAAGRAALAAVEP